MVAKYFCDCCKKELRAEDHRRLLRAKSGITVQVMVAVNNVWNDGHVCHACVIKAVSEGDDLSNPLGLLGPPSGATQATVN